MRVAVVLTVALLVVTAGVPLAAATPGETPNVGDSLQPPVAIIDPTLSASTEPVVVFVQFIPADLPSGLNRTATIAALQAHANRTQTPALTFTEKTDGVRSLQRFWLTNAILVEVDPERVPLTTLAALPEVTRIHPNEKHTLYQAGTTASSDVLVSVGNGTTAGKTTEAGSATDRPGTPSAPELSSGDVRPSAGIDVPPGVVRSGVPSTWGVSRVRAPEVWTEFGTRGAGVSVAVLDTGVDASHPDIGLYTADSTDPTFPGGWAEFDTFGRQVPGSVPHDIDGHGTHVSGTVAGQAASGVHIGVAPDALLMHGLVFSPDPNGGPPIYHDAAKVAGVQWAVLEGADVVSMSFGSGGFDPSDIEMVRNAQAAGTVMVAAIGNEYFGTSRSPGNVHDTLSVGATTRLETVADFSSGQVVNTDSDWGGFAPTDWPESYVVPVVDAPGFEVYSATPGGGYVPLPGTSMATPHVSGVVALMLAAAAEPLTPDEVRAVLVETATKPRGAPPDADPRFGEGVVDGLAATRAVAGSAAPVPAFEVEPNDDFTSATTVPADAQVRAALAVADTDVFAIQGTAGAAESVTLDRESDLGVTGLVVYGPDRALLGATFVGDGDPASVEWVAATDGTHFVQVVDVQSGLGPYLLTIGDGARPAPGPVPPDDGDNGAPTARVLPRGGTLDGDVESIADEDWYRLGLDAAGTVELPFDRTGGTGTLVAEILDSDGNSLGRFPVEPDGATTIFVSSPIPGTYYMVVAPDLGGGNGPYTVLYAG